MKQCPDGPDSEASPFPLVKHTKVAKPAKVVLEYLQSGYLVKTGCSTRDVRVKRWAGSSFGFPHLLYLNIHCFPPWSCFLDAHINSVWCQNDNIYYCLSFWHHTLLIHLSPLWLCRDYHGHLAAIRCRQPPKKKLRYFRSCDITIGRLLQILLHTQKLWVCILCRSTEARCE